MCVLRFIHALFERIFLIIGVLVGAQIPLFINQYIQRLSGHASELNFIVENLKQLAAQSNKTLNEYLAKFQSNLDPDFVKHGDFMVEVVKRQEKMNEALQNLLGNPQWQKLYFFFHDLQKEIAKEVLIDFQPGINLTLEGLGYMALGGIASFLFYCFFIGLIRFLQRVILLFTYKITSFLDSFSKSLFSKS